MTHPIEGVPLIHHSDEQRTQPTIRPDRQQTGSIEGVFLVHATHLTGEQREQLAGILGRAAAAPSITEPVAAVLRRAAAGARLLIPKEMRQAETRRRLDAALTPDGRVRERWNHNQ